MDWLDLDNLLKLLHTSDISDTPSQEETHAEMVQFNVFTAFSDAERYQKQPSQDSLLSHHIQQSFGTCEDVSQLHLPECLAYSGSTR